MFGGVLSEEEIRVFFQFNQLVRGRQKTVDTALVVIHQIGVGAGKFGRTLFDGLNAGGYGLQQVVTFFVGVGRSVINNAVDNTGGPQFVRGYADILGAFLPRQVVFTRNAGQTLRLDGVENTIAHTQQNVGGGQRNGTTGIAGTPDNTDGRYIVVGHFGNQVGNAVGLVGGVSGFTGIGTGGVDKGHNRHGTTGKSTGNLSRTIMVLRAPGAMGVFAVLTDKTDPALLITKGYIGFGAVQRAVFGFGDDAGNQVLDDVFGTHAAAVFAGRDGLLNVAVDIQLAQAFYFGVALGRRDQAFNAVVNGVVFVFGKQGKVSRQLLGFLEQLVDAAGSRFKRVDFLFHW